MIDITFNPKTFELSLTGHANYGKKGEDIVCSAVSTLFYTLGQALIESEDMLMEAPILIDDDGNGFISCKPKAEFEGNIARTYWTILIGFQIIEQTYKEYLKLTVSGT